MTEPLAQILFLRTCLHLPNQLGRCWYRGRSSSGRARRARTRSGSMLGPAGRGGRVRNVSSRTLSNSDISRAAALLAFDNNVHVNLRPELQTGSRPSPEVVAGVNCAAHVHTRTNGPVLLEIRVLAVDGRSVDALLLPDLVSPAVALQASVLRRADVI